MQAQFTLDKSLAKNLIQFFGDSWIDSHIGYGYTPEQASKYLIQHIEYCLEQGFNTTWSLGGVSNNCWGDSSPVSAEIEPELPFLDEFFIEFYPQVSFMQYKIVSKMIQRDSYSDSDYYGGSTQNGKKSLSFSDLSQGMIQAKIMTQPELVKISSLEDFIKESYCVEVLASTFKPKMKKKAKK